MQRQENDFSLEKYKEAEIVETTEEYKEKNYDIEK
jgi:hypothetical protein